MQRIGRWTRLQPGAEEEYERTHKKLWPEFEALIQQSGIKNYTIFRNGLDMFSYSECEDFEAASTFLADKSIAQKWQEEWARLMDAPDPIQPWQPMKEVFHLD